jgi:DNA polymerase (family 10)
MDNQQIADVLSEVADILDIQGENVFRVNAYRRGAQIIAHYPHDFREMYAKSSAIEKIPGIGLDLERKIIEMVTTERCAFHEELVATIPKGLLEMLHVRESGSEEGKVVL